MENRRPTLADMELNMHDNRQNADAATTAYIRELKSQLNKAFQEITNLRTENEKLKPKKTDK